MEVWLIRNGKKSGPYHDYDVRSKIGDGDLGPDDSVWHEGLSEWTKLGEIDLFRGEFKDTEAVGEVAIPPELPEKFLKRAANATEEKPKRYLARRFWGRWLDLVMYSAVWWLGMYLVGRDIEAVLRNPWLQLTIYVPWFVIEAWLIHRFGSTPGKWLMGLGVRNEDGSKLELKPSIWRALRVLVTGIGFGWAVLSLLCQGLSWFTTRRLGKPIWDQLGGHKLVAVRLNPIRIVALVILFIAAAQLQMAVRGPHEEKILSEDYPQFKEFFDDRPKWYLPVKN